MDAAKEQTLVDYGDGVVATRTHLECLLDNKAMVNNEMANAYIRLLQCVKGLKSREDGEAYLETAYIFGMLK
uniref:Uncharacterized protein n=1 Tax=Arundo donax TaxID=35708 RepID=A0A0A9DN89_ARUDO